MNFPTLSTELHQLRLQHPSRSKIDRIRMVLDTDTYNEIDDQFAVVYSLLAPERLKVEAIYAAPFTNDRSTGPGDGMEKSYTEILRLLARLNVPPEGLVHRGSTRYLKAAAGVHGPGRTGNGFSRRRSALRGRNWSDHQYWRSAAG
jgi:hypothetical protein